MIRFGARIGNIHVRYPLSKYSLDIIRIIDADNLTLKRSGKKPEESFPDQFLQDKFPSLARKC